MTENNLNRFTYGSNERWEDVLIDNLEKKEYDLYSIDSLCNRLWEQTQRFEKENQRLNTEIEQLKSEKQAITDILDEMENGDCFWDRDYLIENIFDIESILGLEYE